jgi:hypothetical protein
MSPRRQTPIKTTVYISPGLYRWFKHYGFDEGETLASLVERAMTEFAQQHGYVPEEEEVQTPQEQAKPHQEENHS